MIDSQPPEYYALVKQAKEIEFKSPLIIKAERDIIAKPWFYRPPGFRGDVFSGVHCGVQAIILGGGAEPNLKAPTSDGTASGHIINGWTQVIKYSRELTRQTSLTYKYTPCTIWTVPGV